MQSVTVLQFGILPAQHPHTCWSPVSYVPAFPGSHHLLSHEKSCRNFTNAVSSVSSSLLPCLFFTSNAEALQDGFQWRKQDLTHLCVQSYAQHLGKAQGSSQDNSYFIGLYLRPGMTTPSSSWAWKDIIHTGTSWLKHTTPGHIKVDSGTFVWL